MRSSVVKKLWSEGKPALCAAVTFNDPAVTELVSLLGYHCIWIDLEHHLLSVESAGQMMRGARVGNADVLARPANGEYARLSRLLEAGATGILYPRCELAREAEEAVRWAKFAPLGERGFDGGNPDMPYGMMNVEEYIARANEETFLFCQIESPRALAQSRAIAEVEGVDGLFFGPGDFSVLSGLPGQVDSLEVWLAMEQVCRDALAAGKRFGTLVFSDEGARRVLDMGGTFICCGADMSMLRRALLAMRSQFRDLGFELGQAAEPTVSSYAMVGGK